MYCQYYHSDLYRDITLCLTIKICTEVHGSKFQVQGSFIFHGVEMNNDVINQKRLTDCANLALIPTYSIIAAHQSAQVCHMLKQCLDAKLFKKNSE